MGSEGRVKGEVPLCWSPVGKDGFRRESTRGNRKGRRRKMQSDLGKVFVGGISRDTDGECLKEYFSCYGEVLEAVSMRDRSTGRARGFGFVVFADPAAAQRVLQDKHIIDGRMVEAKKAVPRDDQSTTSRSSSSIQGSPGPGRTRKIFVGGLASTVTESDFKMYFDQFGTITDVAVMYDHNTRRPRGFGFITYDSEDAVDKVLLKTFHELNGKLVEVKRAVPKEMSPGPTQSPLGGYNYGSSIPVGYDGWNGRNTSFFSSGTRNLWEHGGINHGTSSTPSSPYGVSGSGTVGGNFSNNWVNWGSSPISPDGGSNAASHGRNIGYGGGDNNYGLGGGGYGRNIATSGARSPFEVEGLFKQEGSSSNTYFSS
ncbi:hypothetical protein RHMOL_Rhmol09G0017500 [Rhododendron molle]|uniref:Uncharacterized protein n=1 Tax=Rhododendron molle TaxID=49168 RepID=A0ACC0M8S5_RHOML|nr:hypothetical protein RHMOL_Rhmol09G0017500 [Rhododendron molle]